MKILLTHKNCLIGGMETFMAALAPIFKARGHHCELFFFQRGSMEQYLPAGLAVHFGDLTDCLKLIHSRGFDVVHCSSIDFAVGVSAVRRLGAKLVVNAQGATSPFWNSTTCDMFIACAKWLADEQRRFTDLPIHVVMNGVDTRIFKPRTDSDVPVASPPIVAWVGRGVDGAKQIGKLAAVAPFLHASGIKLWLAEPHGPEEVERIEPWAVKVLKPLVDFWGAVPKEQMPAFYQQVAASGGCVLSTSISEGLPLALLEAQACGCPVIGANVRGVNECVDPNHGGVLYEFDIAPDLLANLVVDVINDHTRMKWRRKACVEYVRERFSIEKVADALLRIYSEALQSKGRHSRDFSKRLHVSPLNWRSYVANRWTPGICQYEASRSLARQGEWKLSAAAARASFATCPSLYARPQRLIHLLRSCLRTGFDAKARS
jgi:glycosyltransferase involved in cell wall biosynthesis